MPLLQENTKKTNDPSGATNTTAQKDLSTEITARNNISEERSPLDRDLSRTPPNSMLERPKRVEPSKIETPATPVAVARGPVTGTTGIKELDSAIGKLHPENRLASNASLNITDYTAPLDLVLKNFKDAIGKTDEQSKRVREQCLVILSALKNPTPAKVTDPQVRAGHENVATNLVAQIENSKDGLHSFTSAAREALLKNDATSFLRESLVRSVTNRLEHLLTHERIEKGILRSGFKDPAEAKALVSTATDLIGAKTAQTKELLPLASHALTSAEILKSNTLAEKLIGTLDSADRFNLFSLNNSNSLLVRAALSNSAIERLDRKTHSSQVATEAKSELEDFKSFVNKDPLLGEWRKKFNEQVEILKTFNLKNGVIETDEQLIPVKAALKHVVDQGTLNQIQEMTRLSSDPTVRFDDHDVESIIAVTGQLMKDVPKLGTATLRGDLGHNPPQYVTQAAINSQFYNPNVARPDLDALRTYTTRTLSKASAQEPLTENQSWNIRYIQNGIKDRIFVLDNALVAWDTPNKNQRNIKEGEPHKVKVDNTTFMRVTNRDDCQYLDRAAGTLGESLRSVIKAAKDSPEIFKGGPDTETTKRDILVRYSQELLKSTSNPFLDKKLNTPIPPIPGIDLKQPLPSVPDNQKNRPAAFAPNRTPTSAIASISDTYKRVFEESLTNFQAREVGRKVIEVAQDPEKALAKLKKNNTPTTTIAA